MKKLFVIPFIIAFMLASSVLQAQDEWGLSSTNYTEFDDIWRSGLTTVGYRMEPAGSNANTLGWPAQLHIVNNRENKIGLQLTRVLPSPELPASQEPFIKVGHRNSQTDPNVVGTTIDPTFYTRLIFTHDTKLGIGTETPEERLTVRNGSMFIDLENAAPDHSLGVLVRGQSRPLITAFDTRASMDDRFLSGPFKNAGMFGMLMDGGALTFSIKRQPGNYEYREFKFVGSDHDGSMKTFMSINENGVVGINCAETSPGAGDQINLHWATGYKLHVRGGIRTNKVKVDIDYASWPDYVFAEDYKLRSLDEVAAYISENKHLPDVPSAKELSENGADLAKMDATLLKKIEEMTLYMLELKHENEAIKKELAQLSK